MNKITINLDLEANELLEKEVEEALRGYARKIAREVMQDEIQKEMSRLMNLALMEGLKPPVYSGHPESAGRLYGQMYNAVSMAIKDGAINVTEIVESVLGKQTEYNIDYIVDRKVRAVSEQIQKSLTDSFYTAFSEANAKALMNIVAQHKLSVKKEDTND